MRAITLPLFPLPVIVVVVVDAVANVRLSAIRPTAIDLRQGVVSTRRVSYQHQRCTSDMRASRFASAPKIIERRSSSISAADVAGYDVIAGAAVDRRRPRTRIAARTAAADLPRGRGPPRLAAAGGEIWHERGITDVDVTDVDPRHSLRLQHMAKT